MRFARKLVIALSTVMSVATANAAATYQDGSITNVTFIANTVLIMLSPAGPPDNCAGTPAGWMMVPAEDKMMQAFVLGLWMRGDSPSTVVRVFTSAYSGSGYCQINQIDPPG